LIYYPSTSDEASKEFYYYNGARTLEAFEVFAHDYGYMPFKDRMWRGIRNWW
jgi:hypothetical protein